MFGSLILFLLTGFPVAFSLAACGLMFGFLGMELGLLPPSLFQALPLRVFGIIQNDTLLAIPFFTLMGLILERSGMAEDLLDTVGQVFGPIRGGLALAVIFVGALLAATTGVVAASVISMGLISLPIMLRYGYSPAIASGAITASGTLAQIIPPSLVLIVMADQLGRSVGDLYKGAFIPAFVLVGLYALFIIGLAIFKPTMVPALPPEARAYRQPDGSSGIRSLVVFGLLVSAVSMAFGLSYGDILSAIKGEDVTPALDETIVIALTGGTLLALVGALINKALGLGLLSRITERVTFVLIPPLALIFLVLGTIFLGIATPTEGGAMGAVGGMIMAWARGKLDMGLLKHALESTARLSCFVLFILIGSTVFSFTFNAADGHIWVEHLFTDMPGGGWGFLIVVNLLVFVLGMFIDFFEIAFIVLPLLAPVAEKILPGLVPGMTPDMAMIWFGVIIAMNLQTSFLTPPFGFALFYLRSVAAKFDYKDRVTGQTIRAVSTNEIYKGSIAFIVLQLIMVVAIMTFPSLVVGNMAKDKGLSDAAVMEQLQMLDTEPMDGDDEPPAEEATPAGNAAPALEAPPALDEEPDPMAAMQDAIAKDGKKAKP